jgi:two-component system, cell cycle response regulator
MARAPGCYAGTLMNGDMPIKSRSAPGVVDITQPSGTVPLSDDDLLGGELFGAAPVVRAPPPPGAAHAADDLPPLRIAVQGLKPIERQLLHGLVKVSQRRTPRLEIVDDRRAREADVVVVDTRDPAAMAWAHERPWLARRAVIWIDGIEAAPGHTLLRRPVQWPILPMVLARALEAGPDSAGAASPAPGHRAVVPLLVGGFTPHVLVVDDGAATRAQLRALLEAGGYAVTEAESVATALDELARQHFDCVLMDVVMPDVDGYEGCHRIKAGPHGDTIPVVMVTSRGSPFDHLHGKMAGCDAYLTKPVDPGLLAEVLAQHAGLPQPPRAEPRTPEIPTRRY